MHRSASQILVTVKSALIMWPACRVNDACPWISLYAKPVSFFRIYREPHQN